MEQSSKRDTLIHLFDASRVNGVAYLFALIALGSATAPELADVCGDERHTIGRYLQRLESRGFAMRVQSGRGELWYPTPLALTVFSGRIQVEILPESSSSSSDLFLDQVSQIRSDSEEEETRQKIYLNTKLGLTGDKARAVAADPWITPLRLVAWMGQTSQMERDGFKFTKSPEAYALRCLLRHDEPNQHAYHMAPAMLREYLRYMPSDDDDEEEEEDDDTNTPTSSPAVEDSSLAADVDPDADPIDAAWNAALKRSKYTLGLDLYRTISEKNDVYLDDDTIVIVSPTWLSEEEGNHAEQVLTEALQDITKDKSLHVRFEKGS